MPDLGGYPSGLVSVAVVAYYAVLSDKDDLTVRRRLAGLGFEHLGRDLATGPRKTRDLIVKGIVINRRPDKFQRSSWDMRTCGTRKGGRYFDNVAPLLNGRDILLACTDAFADISQPVKEILETRPAFGTEGHWLAGLAAFCQIVQRLPDGDAALANCKANRNDFAALLQNYADLKAVVDGKTNVIEMPLIHGKSVTDLQSLYVRADPWEGGGRPIYVSCNIFIRVIGYCVGYSYGQIMAGAHLHLDGASWAASIYVQFPRPAEAMID